MAQNEQTTTRRRLGEGTTEAAGPKGTLSAEWYEQEQAGWAAAAKPEIARLAGPEPAAKSRRRRLLAKPARRPPTKTKPARNPPRKYDHKELKLVQHDTYPDLIYAAHDVLVEEYRAHIQLTPAPQRAALAGRNTFRDWYADEIRRDIPDLCDLPHEFGSHVATWLHDEYMKAGQDIDRVDISKRPQTAYFEYINPDDIVVEQIGIQKCDVTFTLPKNLGTVTVRCDARDLSTELAYLSRIRSITLRRAGDGGLWLRPSFHRDDKARQQKLQRIGESYLTALRLAVEAFRQMEPCANADDGAALISGKRMREYMRSKRYEVRSDNVLAGRLRTLGVHPELVRTGRRNRERYYRGGDVYKAFAKVQNDAL